MRTEPVDHHAQRPGRGDPRVLLPQGPSGRVARIGERCLSRLYERGIELLESGDRQIDLAANLEQLRDRRTRALDELGRDVVDGADVGRDVFAGASVAPGRRSYEPAVVVDERDR